MAFPQPGVGPGLKTGRAGLMSSVSVVSPRGPGTRPVIRNIPGCSVMIEKSLFFPAWTEPCVGGDDPPGNAGLHQRELEINQQMEEISWPSPVPTSHFPGKQAQTALKLPSAAPLPPGIHHPPSRRLTPDSSARSAHTFILFPGDLRPQIEILAVTGTSANKHSAAFHVVPS